MVMMVFDGMVMVCNDMDDGMALLIVG